MKPRKRPLPYLSGREVHKMAKKHLDREKADYRAQNPGCRIVGFTRDVVLIAAMQAMRTELAGLGVKVRDDTCVLVWWDLAPSAKSHDDRDIAAFCSYNRVTARVWKVVSAARREMTAADLATRLDRDGWWIEDLAERIDAHIQRRAACEALIQELRIAKAGGLSAEELTSAARVLVQHSPAYSALPVRCDADLAALLRSVAA